MTLTKAGLIHRVYREHKTLSREEATAMVEAFLVLGKESLVDGSDLLLSGFGKFQIRDKRERRGRNPQTGEKLTLRPRRVITFKPSGILRKKINEPTPS